MRILDRLFGKPEEINGKSRCPTYLYRWVLLKTPQRCVYLHHFVGDDWSHDFHDHPKRFVSIGLKGWYVEETPGAPDRVYRAPWFRSFPAEYIHRIKVPSRSCWTLVIVGRHQREWGFWHEGRWHQWLEYVRGVGGLADKMKNCP